MGIMNFHQRVVSTTQYSRQFSCRGSLITVFNCPASARLMSDKFVPMWSQYNYIVYVTEGRKIWHTGHGTFELKEGACVFVRKGAWILEQFFDIGFCVVMFFIPDEFLCAVLKSKAKPISRKGENYDPIIPLANSDTLAAFFLSMSSFFGENRDPDDSLLELKFRELILTIADNPANEKLLAYFCSLLREPQSVWMQRIMEDNFRFNLRLEEYAELCNRSLSAFKRDFQKTFHTAPGKWLHEKRLDYARNLLVHQQKTVAEASFESGFESASHFSRAYRKKFGHSPSAEKTERSAMVV